MKVSVLFLIVACLAQSIVAQTAQNPIPRGGAAVGRFALLVRGDRVQEIGVGAATITVTISDYTDRSYTGSFKGSGSRERLKYVPGDKAAPAPRSPMPSSNTR